MFDIKFIIENPEKVAEGAKNKNIKVDVDKIVELANLRKEKLIKLENLRAHQNEVSKNIPTAKDKTKLLAEMKELKEILKTLEPEIELLEKQIDELAAFVPNPISSTTPVGKDETGNVVVKTYGKQPKFKFTPKDHITLGKDLDIIDIERGAR